MKYSLLSLFVVVTLVAVVLGGRIEYLRRWVVFHEERAQQEDKNYDRDFANEHRRIAQLYREALLRPWTDVEETVKLPDWVPDSHPSRAVPMKSSVRDLLWLTLVVALAVAWWLDRRSLVALIRARDAQRKMVLESSLEPS
ncbi:MAG: hypothetical protein ACKVP0_25720 [Pirellulaceae bacterium]